MTTNNLDRKPPEHNDLISTIQMVRESSRFFSEESGAFEPSDDAILVAASVLLKLRFDNEFDRQFED